MMMKRLFFAATGLFMMAQTFAQNTEPVTNKNSWLKGGLTASVPVGNTANVSSFAAGLDLSGQWMATPNLGLGVSTGYTHYFAKNSGSGFGTVPLGALIHYYPQSSGFFAGTDLGYSFITNSTETGGLYIKPKLGYHNYDWNFFGFYNQVFASSMDVQNVGVGVVYNIRFK
ncbi:MAG: hypothetical protein ABI581_03820 [Sediminibacterium sp.]